MNAGGPSRHQGFALVDRATCRSLPKLTVCWRPSDRSSRAPNTQPGMTQEPPIKEGNTQVRAVFAVVLSVCAIAAVAVHELSPETIAEVRAQVGWAPQPELVSPVVAETPPLDPEDVDPSGPAKLRPGRAGTQGERRASPRASPRRPLDR
jgi:hypothetical protein